MQKTKKIGIYFHWPYCKSKCPYCDFYKEIHCGQNQDEIIDSYIQDLDFYKDFILPEHLVVSVFFGGGTPSLIEPKNIEKLLNHISKNFPISSDMEISLEANPNTDCENLFSDIKSAGINRLSLGVQSFDNTELKFLGRTHSAEQALKSVDSVLKNFNNHSIDLMYALPNQTVEKWQKSLEFAADLGLKHISLYQLTIERSTVFEKKNISTLPEDEASKLYFITEDYLKTKGYHKYEVSNFALNGSESVHNLLYWQGDDYIGIGKSSHGRIGMKATEHPRKIFELTSKERAEELIIMGLRLTKGIDKQKFFNICGIKFDDFINHKFLQDAIAQNLLINSAKDVRATKDGFLILNYLIKNLCP